MNEIVFGAIPRVVRTVELVFGSYSYILKSKKFCEKRRKVRIRLVLIISRALVCPQQQHKIRTFSVFAIPYSVTSSRIGFRSIGAGLGLGDGVGVDDGSEEAVFAAVGAADGTEIGLGDGLGLGDVMPDVEMS